MDDKNVVDINRAKKPKMAKKLQQIVADPKQDFVAGLAHEILSCVREKSKENPIGVLAALHLVGRSVSMEYIERYTREAAQKMVTQATIISSQYQPQFKETSDDNGTMEGDPEDKS